MKNIIIISVLLFSVSCANPAQELKQTNSPKNVIFMIGDGMGIAQIQAAMIANGNTLNLDRMISTGFSKTSSASDGITDSAAGATAFSIGKKTYNKAIGVDKDTVAQKTVLEYAEEAGLSTGLVATSSITHATPASFIAHQPYRNMAEEIAADFLKTDIDVFIGGGKNYFVDRKDGEDLTLSLKSNGYQVIFEQSGLANITSGKLAALLAPDGMPPFSKGRGDMLAPSAMKAIELLNQNEKGFFLMIEGSQIDWGGHGNDIEYVVSELLDFDNTIGQVLDFAEKDGNTLVIITADHETGGLTILGDDILGDSTATNFSTDYHTSVMVPVYAKGPGEEAFVGTYENNLIFNKIMSALRIDSDN
ncbi:MAG: alkaline phosphatase [Cyclobacteriaceae bacterium]|nr:alkaline phosphatase [Cyclobacteriaceae bacterium]